MSWREDNVRLARVDDAPAIAEVHVANWRTTYKGIFSDPLLDSLSVDKREQSWRETLALPEPNSVTLVACNVDGSIVGFISGGAERTGRLGYEGELYAIYLLQLAQRQGLGTLLVQHFVRELRVRASVRWPYGFWWRILLGNFMMPSEGKLSRNSRSNVAANRSQKALTVGKI